MAHLLKHVWLALLLPLAAGIVGCERPPLPAPPPPPPTPEVMISTPVTGEITDFEDFTGRTEAVRTVDIRARVTGYLAKRNFKEGSEVEEGDLLFEIDARPYLAELARAEANLHQAEAHLKRLDLDYNRSVNLTATKALSPQEFDKVAGDRAEGAAAMDVAKAQRDTAKLSLSFCRVTSPVKGRMSRGAIDPGNMVKADDTLLSTIVTQDPMYAYFDVDERTMLRLQRRAQEGKINKDLSDVPVFMVLADEEGYPHQGQINFEDNRVDASTGTLRVRGIFHNADHMLAPGLFVRVRLPIGQSYQAVLIAEQAVGTDQGRKFVYVVEQDNKVVYRPVKLGRYNGQRVVVKGISPDDRIVVNGLQRVRPGTEVRPKLVEMPGGLAAKLSEEATETAMAKGK